MPRRRKGRAKKIATKDSNPPTEAENASLGKIDDGFKQDFQAEVEHRVREMRVHAEDYKKQLESTFDHLLSQIPKRIRTMTLKELREEEMKEQKELGSISSVIAYVNMKTQDYLSNENQGNLKDDNFATPAPYMSSTTKTQKKRKPLGPATDNIRNQVARPLKIRKGTTQASAVRQSARLASRTNTKRTNEAFQHNFLTPAAKRTIAQLSSTIATGVKSRNIRPGEIGVSVNGSPITNFDEQIPMNNKLVQLLASKKVPSKLDDDTLQGLNRWKERMDQILLQANM